MLIECPKCGKPVSDKAKKCLHCGVVINKTQDAEKNSCANNKTEYYELDKEDRKRLLLEFGKEEPLHYKNIRNNFMRTILQIVVGGIASLLTILGLIILFTTGIDRLDVAKPQAVDFIIAFGTLAVAILMYLMLGVCMIINKLSRQKDIIAFKHYETWLNKRDIIGYADFEMENSREREKLEDLNI